jgi:hypothetical protein
LVGAPERVTRDQLLNVYQGRPIALRQTGRLGDLLAASDIRAWLAEADLLTAASAAPPETDVEILAWEVQCHGKVEDIALAVLGAETHSAITVGDRALFYQRATVAR